MGLLNFRSQEQAPAGGRLVLLSFLTIIFWVGALKVVAGSPPTPSVDTVKDVAARAPSFKQDVIPILTKYGCNAGGCHGKQAGQNHFRLSLRGYAPEMDYEWLVHEFGGRRIHLGAPEKSLILQKASNEVPHEGGHRFGKESRAYGVLRDWVAARAPGPVREEAEPEELRVLPGDMVLDLEGSQRLMVEAVYSDGRVRDVTWLAQFFSNDESTVAVSEEGVVRALRAGEAGVRVHFQGLVEVVTFTMPHEVPTEEGWYEEVGNEVDRHVMSKLKQLRIPPSPPASDEEFVRRVFLDTIGVLPTATEVEAFLQDTNPDRREALVDQLLERPEWAEYWALQLADLLQNRKERDHDVRGVKGVRAFYGWLHGQLRQNKGWDEVAREVLTARGSVNNHPEVGYFITTLGEHRNPAESELPDSVAQAFLGTRIGCARCHNHPLEKYTQDDFYQFAAFFSRTSLARVNPKQGSTELVIGSREERELEKRVGRLKEELEKIEDQLAEERLEESERGELEKRREGKGKELVREQERQVELAMAMPRIRQPRTGEELPPRSLDREQLRMEPGADPRAALADWIVDVENELFSGAMVNRVWKHFLGVGLVEPVDDLRASNPPSNQELWKALKDEFVQSGYDLKALMRLICTSRTYQLSSATVPRNQNDDRFYSHYYVKRLPSEVLMDAVSQVTGVPEQFAGYPVGLRAAQVPDPSVQSYFLNLFGRSDRVTACACERKNEVTLPQLLHLYNGQSLREKIRHPNGRLAMLRAQEAGVEGVIERLFLTALARPPRGAEKAHILDLVREAVSEEAALEDVVWALLNLKEFAFNH